MPQKNEHHEWLFKWITPLQAMRVCVVLVLLFSCMALGAAAGWCFTRTANSNVTYEYKAVSIEEYLEKNGTSVLSYDEFENQVAVMMTEDLINTILNEYLEANQHKLQGYKVYEMVYRQKEGKFHIQMQSGLFRVPVQAKMEVSWDSVNKEIVIVFSQARQGEDDSFWGSWMSAPQMPEVRVPVSMLGLPDWIRVVDVKLNTNEMLLYLQPDLLALVKRARENIQVDGVYLDWQSYLEDCPMIIRRLHRIANGDNVTTADVRTFLKIMIDRQEELLTVLAVADQSAVAGFIERYQDFLTDDITLEACQQRRDNIEEHIRIDAARQLLKSLESYIEEGVGLTPPQLQVSGESVDNSYVNFTDRSKLEGTAIVIQTESSGGDAQLEWTPEAALVVDAGVIYDYNVSAFITPKWIAQQYPLDIPHVNFLDKIRFYYQAQTGTAVVLITEQDGNIKVLNDTGYEVMSVVQVEKLYPGYTRTPVIAVVPDMENATRTAIVEVLGAEIGEGEILTRYMCVCSNSAFVVFSTEEHAERVRSAVLEYDEEWLVMDYDVSDYQQYMYFHPGVNGTIFPAENIAQLTVRTIPEAGLQKLLDKAVQLNLVNKRQSIDYYYYIGSYVYTHFTSGKECVFRVNDNEEIISCRSVASAEANWDLPPFFVLEASR